MAQRGRKPKPTALKMLEGNPGGRPLNTKEPKPEKKAPRCPSWLEDEAKKEWKRMAKVLEQMGLLTEMDMAAFAGYCQAYARWKEAEEFLEDCMAVVLENIQEQTSCSRGGKHFHNAERDQFAGKTDMV